jgi:hypothetical protein
VAGAVEGLLKAYSAFVRIPWERGLGGPQRVWFAIYDPPQERRLRLRLEEFAIATRDAGHGWVHRDITTAYEEWMATHRHRDAYFAEPEFFTYARDAFASHLADIVREALTADEVDENTVVAVSGVGALFGLTSVSQLTERLAPAIRGRLLVFFPGDYDGTSYRLLDAKDGWNYLAVPITAANGGD